MTVWEGLWEQFTFNFSILSLFENKGFRYSCLSINTNALELNLPELNSSVKFRWIQFCVCAGFEGCHIAHQISIQKLVLLHVISIWFLFYVYITTKIPTGKNAAANHLHTTVYLLENLLPLKNLAHVIKIASIKSVNSTFSGRNTWTSIGCVHMTLQPCKEAMV